MAITAPFDVQGHRGARGLKPENTLPSFEVALDLGVTTIETDLHLTRDKVPILHHDSVITDTLCEKVSSSSSPDPAARPLVSSLTVDQLRGYRANRNPNHQRFPRQDAGPTALATQFAGQRGWDPYAPPTLEDLLDFAAAYGGELGVAAGKSSRQQERVQHVVFDLELKRVPFRPEIIGDDFDGETPGILEQRVVEAILSRGVRQRTIVRSFDHRCLRAIRRLEPELGVAVLVAGTAPVSLVDLVRQAEARVYCPDFEFLDLSQIRQAHAGGILVKPWTVNDPRDWARLLDWGVDGITTDVPDQLMAWLDAAGIGYGPNLTNR